MKENSHLINEYIIFFILSHEFYLHFNNANIITIVIVEL